MKNIDSKQISTVARWCFLHNFQVPNCSACFWRLLCGYAVNRLEMLSQSERFFMLVNIWSLWLPQNAQSWHQHHQLSTINIIYHLSTININYQLLCMVEKCWRIVSSQNSSLTPDPNGIDLERLQSRNDEEICIQRFAHQQNSAKTIDFVQSSNKRDEIVLGFQLVFT